MEGGSPGHPRRRNLPTTSAGRPSTSVSSRGSSPTAPCVGPRPAPSHRRPEDASDDDRQRRRGQPRDRAQAPPRPLPARPPRADRHPLGLRHQQLRSLRRPDGRRAGEVLHRARGDGRRPRGPHRRGPREQRRTRPGAAGFHGGARAAVRLLHPGHDDDGPRPARPQPRSHRCGDPRGTLGQLCRCTGYATIVRSVRWAAEHPAATPATAGAE